MNRLRLGWAVVWIANLAIVAATGSRVSGEVVKIVSPSAQESLEGDLVRQPESVPTRLQVLIPASHFAELPTTHRLIVAWNFRADASQPVSVDWNFGDAQVFMSTTDKTPETLSNVFDDNHGADKTLVQDGAISFPLLATGPPQGPRDFAAGQRLETPFFYDPAQGNLLVERVTLGGIPVSPLIDAQTYTGPGARGLVSTVSATAATGTLGKTPAVLQFEFEVVPEPSSLLVGGTAILGLFVCRRKRSCRSRM
jgi:hypothetical protein